MQLAEAPTFNGRVLAGCSPAGLARCLWPGQSGPKRVAWPECGVRVVCRAFIYHDQHGISVHFQIK
jgi:hypothetical protein